MLSKRFTNGEALLEKLREHFFIVKSYTYIEYPYRNLLNPFTLFVPCSLSLKPKKDNVKKAIDLVPKSINV